MLFTHPQQFMCVYESCVFVRKCFDIKAKAKKKYIKLYKMSQTTIPLDGAETRESNHVICQSRDSLS